MMVLTETRQCSVNLSEVPLEARVGGERQGDLRLCLTPVIPLGHFSSICLATVSLLF